MPRINLLPCPFCGGAAKLEKMGYPHHVFCTECYARVTGVGMDEKGETDAIKRWNARSDNSPDEDGLEPGEERAFLCFNPMNREKKEPSSVSLRFITTNRSIAMTTAKHGWLTKTGRKRGKKGKGGDPNAQNQ